MIWYAKMNEKVIANKEHIIKTLNKLSHVVLKISFIYLFI